WETIKLPKPLSGLGILNLALQNLALGAKLVWNFISDAKWLDFQVLSHKYLEAGRPELLLSSYELPKGFHIWNFICNCKSMIANSVSWQIHNGQLVTYWEDSWNGSHPLNLVLNLNRVMNVTSASWGTKVVDFGLQHPNGLPSWQWKNISTIGASLQESSTLFEALRARHVHFNEGEDQLLWLGDNTYTYT
ncbi:hypothetical protein KI387_011581, partial [Taxus chinensis]